MKLLENHYYIEVQQIFKHELNYTHITYKLLDVTNINDLYQPIDLNNSSKFILVDQHDTINKSIMDTMIKNKHIFTSFINEQCIILNYCGYILTLELLNGYIIESKGRHSLTEAKINIGTKSNKQIESIINKLSLMDKKCSNIGVYGDEISIDMDSKTKADMPIILKFMQNTSKVRLRLDDISLIDKFIGIDNIIEICIKDRKNTEIDLNNLRFNNKYTCILYVIKILDTIKCNTIEFTNDIWINSTFNPMTVWSINRLIGSKYIKYLYSITLRFTKCNDYLDLRGIVENYDLYKVAIEYVDTLILNSNTLLYIGRDFKLRGVNKVLSDNTSLNTMLKNKYKDTKIIYYHKSYEEDLVEFNNLQLGERFHRIATEEERQKYLL